LSLWGTEPVGYHVTTLILHIANATLVYAVAKRALGTKPAAVFAGLIFVVQPRAGLLLVAARRHIDTTYDRPYTLLADLSRRGRDEGAQHGATGQCGAH
jgi:hypothetical protein